MQDLKQGNYTACDCARDRTTVSHRRGIEWRSLYVIWRQEQEWDLSSNRSCLYSPGNHFRPSYSKMAPKIYASLPFQNVAKQYHSPRLIVLRRVAPETLVRS